MSVVIIFLLINRFQKLLMETALLMFKASNNKLDLELNVR